MDFSEIYEIFSIGPDGQVTTPVEHPPNGPSKEVKTAMENLIQQLSEGLERLTVEHHPMLPLVERRSKRILSLLEEVRAGDLTGDQRERRLEKAVRKLEKYRDWLYMKKEREKAATTGTAGL